MQASDAQIDLAAVIRAAQAISETIVLDDLLERLMRTLIESAGASRGVLVLVVDGEPRVEAVGSDGEVVVGPSRLLDDKAPAAEQLIRYVVRMGEPMVIADAREPGEFSRDPYLVEGNVRSVLCAPIMGQGRPVAAVYLENNLAANAFTPKRLQVVTMLAGQAAISIENAQLYADLDLKVKQRTAELELRNRFIRDTFGRYVSDTVVDNLLQSPEALAMGGETRVVTVLMADLRGFISKTQGLPPERVVQLVNVFLSAMTEIIMHHGGTIDEFIGDAILAIFGAPVLGEDDASRAIRCALAMQREMVNVNATNASLGLPQVRMGIGLSTGEVVVGNIGSERRTKYGVVGWTVNLASRIESFTRGGDILLPEATRASADFEVVTDRHFAVTMKGQRDPIRLFGVVGIEGEPATWLSRSTPPLVRLKSPIDIRYQRIDDNLVTPSSHVARIVALSSDVALVESELAEEPMTDLLVFLGGDAAPELYAKVDAYEANTGDGTTATFAAHLTSVPNEAARLLARYTEGDDT
jgi:class 3 adenylate cyclase